MLITNQKNLEDLCSKLALEKSVALDTEFVRRDTYYPKLSLIQIATKTETFLVDTINLDLGPFKNLLLNSELLKIFHAPKQDFEIFYHLFKITPVNIFDTQIAAAFCDMRTAISYSDLCNILCYVPIDKTYQAADWLSRPIKPEMLEYAYKDVEYLHDLYDYLSSRIVDRQKYEKRIATDLADPNLYKLSPQNAWKKLKVGPDRTERFIKQLKTLAAFREEIAAGLNVPRGHFISDSALIQICTLLPQNDKAFRLIKWQTKWMKTEKFKNKIIDLCSSLKSS